ncbi:MAG: HIT domain-containing protein [Paracoccaceae bacterium]|nr:HIT domain-containing protein [Paracoccaceae bacterium]
MIKPDCRFCLANELLTDTPLYRLAQFFILGSIDPDRTHQVMIVPYRHIETPFCLNADEWAEIGEALNIARKHLEPANPNGFTVGWNVGATAGQTVFHAHLHVFARFKGEPTEGFGIHSLL